MPMHRKPNADITPRLGINGALSKAQLDDEFAARYDAIQTAAAAAVAAEALAGPHEANHLPGGTDALPWASIIDNSNSQVAAPANAGFIRFNGTTGFLDRSDGSAWVPYAWMNGPMFTRAVNQVKNFPSGAGFNQSQLTQVPGANSAIISLQPVAGPHCAGIHTTNTETATVGFVRLSTGLKSGMGLGLVGTDGNLLLFDVYQADQLTAPVLRISTWATPTSAPVVLATVPCWSLPSICYLSYEWNVGFGNYDFFIHGINDTARHLIGSAPDTGFVHGCVAISTDDATAGVITEMSIVQYAGTPLV